MALTSVCSSLGSVKTVVVKKGTLSSYSKKRLEIRCWNFLQSDGVYVTLFSVCNFWITRFRGKLTLTLCLHQSLILQRLCSFLWICRCVARKRQNLSSPTIAWLPIWTRSIPHSIPMANARLLMAPPAIRKTHQCCIFIGVMLRVVFVVKTRVSFTSCLA